LNIISPGQDTTFVPCATTRQALPNRTWMMNW